MTDSQTKWDNRFLEQAKLVASYSKDPSTKTGAAIVAPNGSLISTGFNGFPQCMEDKPEWYANREEKYSRIIHCEMNAAMYAKRDLAGCTLYTYPFISCDRCFVHMLQLGITRFVAPKATEEQLTRWGSAFERVRTYASDAGVVLIEVDFA
jgi:dCMP deaminase